MMRVSAWVEVDEGLGKSLHYFLHEHEAPKGILKKIEIRDRTCQSSSLHRVQPQICQHRPIRFDRSPEPATGLIDETILVVIDSYRTQSSLREVDYLAAF